MVISLNSKLKKYLRRDLNIRKILSSSKSVELISLIYLLDMAGKGEFREVFSLTNLDNFHKAGCCIDNIYFPNNIYYQSEFSNHHRGRHLLQGRFFHIRIDNNNRHRGKQMDKNRDNKKSL